MSEAPQQQQQDGDGASAWATVGGGTDRRKKSVRNSGSSSGRGSSLQAAAAAGGSASRRAPSFGGPKTPPPQPQQRSKSFTHSGAPPPRTQSSSSSSSSRRRRASSHSAVGGDGSGRGSGGGRGQRDNNNNNNNNSSGRGRGQQQQRDNSSSNSGRGGSGRGSGNKGGRGKGGGGGSQRRPSSSAKLLSDIVLLHGTGAGTTSAERAVVRHSADGLLQHRMLYLEAPQPEQQEQDECEWTPHDRCLWKSSDRLRWIEQQQAVVHNFQPLQVNDATRWKPKSKQSKQQRQQLELEEDHREAAVLDAVQALLNKLSWTNLDRLTVQFLHALSTSRGSSEGANNESGGGGANANATTTAAASIPPELVTAVMRRVVRKAMREPHFAALYARLSVKLAAVHRAFKKSVLQLCQSQFEEQQQEEEGGDPSGGSNGAAADSLNETEKIGNSASENNPTTTTTTTSPAEQRKLSIGLMTFIGELYVNDLIKAPIMLSCLERLLVADDDERLESFCKLMTVAGKRLHRQDDANLTADDRARRRQLWDRVHRMAGHPERAASPPNNNNNSDENGTTGAAPSTRLKFLLQALVELKDNDWVPVRHEHEKAKTIQEIHRQAALEAQQGPVTRTASTLKRSQSSGLSQQQRRASSGSFAAATAAARGNVKQQRKGKNATTSSSDDEDDDSFASGPKHPSLRRVQSESVATTSSLQRAAAAKAAAPPNSRQQQQPQPKPALSKKKKTTTTATTTTMDPKDCADRTKNVLREFFIGGDRDDAVLSLDEMIACGQRGHLDRGAAVLEAGMLLVMEMKEAEVRKFLDLVARLLDDNQLDRACLVRAACGDPLEFLRDIEIDAPLAGHYLSLMLAAWLTKKVDDGETALPDLQFLLRAPEYFRSDGRPAEFCCQVLRRAQSPVDDSGEWELIGKLMSDDERNEFGTPQDFWQAQQRQSAASKK